jgi:hypothetical protein
LPEILVSSQDGQAERNCLLIRGITMRWVTESTYLCEFRLKIRFDNGEIKAVDLQPHLGGPIFEPLKDPEFIDTVAWPNDADFSRDFLYEIGQKISEQDASADARNASG